MSSLTEHVGWLSHREIVQEQWLESIADGVMVIDGKGLVKMMNPAAERLLGCREEDVLGRVMDDLLGSGAQVVKDSLERGIAYSQEAMTIGESGEQATSVQMGVSPVRDDGGTLSGAVVTLTNLGRVKEIEEERSRLGRLAILAEVSGVVAHEIRNPLAGMVAGIQHLLTKFKEGDDRYQDLQRMLKEGERVDRIIEDIMMVTRPPHLNLAPVDLSEVIGEVLSQCADKAEAQLVQMRVYSTPDLPLVKGDTERLAQALLKLVVNGIEAMPDGGQLEIVTTGPSRGEAPYVEMEVRDTGVAMKKEDLERVFEPFCTAKSRGSGLGLVIAKRIIDGHDGEIWLQSEEGEGTRAIVRLPLAGRGES
jgi:PAS domain S-box-containing protein